MLPDDPTRLGRLFRAARYLLGRTQASVAAQAGMHAATIHAIEAGRLRPRAASVQRAMQALERSGVRFLAAVDGMGHGVRYAEAGGGRPEGSPKDDGSGTIPGGPGAAAVPDPALLAQHLTRIEASMERQRRLVRHLDAAGRNVAAAYQLLVTMEQGLDLLRQYRDLLAGSGPAAATDDRARREAA